MVDFEIKRNESAITYNKTIFIIHSSLFIIILVGIVIINYYHGDNIRFYMAIFVLLTIMVGILSIYDLIILKTPKILIKESKLIFYNMDQWGYYDNQRDFWPYKFLLKDIEKIFIGRPQDFKDFPAETYNNFSLSLRVKPLAHLKGVSSSLDSKDRKDELIFVVLYLKGDYKKFISIEGLSQEGARSLIENLERRNKVVNDDFQSSLA